MNVNIKKQKMEDLFKETFEQTIVFYGEENFFFCGKKMYVKLKNSLVISVDFQGTDIAYNSIVLMVCNKYGILDQNITPFKLIFRESKSEIGSEKMINVKQILNATGEYTSVWVTKLSDEDVLSLNNHLITYIELFSSL
jgi:hypothetical protein